MNKDLTVGSPSKVLWQFCLPVNRGTIKHHGEHGAHKAVGNVVELPDTHPPRRASYQCLQRQTSADPLAQGCRTW